MHWIELCSFLIGLSSKHSNITRLLKSSCPNVISYAVKMLFKKKKVRMSKINPEHSACIYQFAELILLLYKLAEK